MKKVKAVVFDLGNVLVRIHPERLLTSLGIVDRDRQLTVRNALVETVRTYERGELATYDCLQKLGEILDYEFDRNAIRRAFASILGDPIAGMDRIVERAALNHTVALVSNTNPIHMALAEANVPSVASLPIRFLSYELRALKPEPAYYDKVLRGLAFRPEEVVFIDDRRENVDAANAAGMSGILFQSPEGLLEALRTQPHLKF